MSANYLGMSFSAAAVLFLALFIAGQAATQTQTTPAQEKPFAWLREDPPRKPRSRRSARARAAFKLANPCPATGSSRGACPGYVIDHIKPLACGGPDSPENMQWQTIRAAREKDKWERIGC